MNGIDLRGRDMEKQAVKVLCALVGTALLVTGCATTRARHVEAQDQAAQVKDLQQQLQAKDQQIQDLQAQVDSSRQSLTGNFAVRSGSSSVIRVPGVTVTDVQRALSR